ncbi:MAG TPA: PspC domain-containing protein [Firmicutes bacterium]|nr:PspC domain-containing protein [Bacillota bacterium]
MRNRVYRSRKYRVIAGVAGGLAEYFDVDVVLVRLLWIISVFAGGGGVLAYIIAWIVIPEENRKYRAGEDDEDYEAKAETEDVVNGEEVYRDKQDAGIRRQRNFGLLLIGLGILFLIRQFFGYYFHYFWPLLLVALGVFLLLRERKGGEK